VSQPRQDRKTAPAGAGSRLGDSLPSGLTCAPARSLGSHRPIDGPGTGLRARRRRAARTGRSWALVPADLKPCWLTDRYGHLPRLLPEWRRVASGFQGRVVRLVQDETGWVIVVEWLPAELLEPGTPSCACSRRGRRRAQAIRCLVDLGPCRAFSISSRCAGIVFGRGWRWQSGASVLGRGRREPEVLHSAVDAQRRAGC
jgi:hypothetical protein